MIFMVDTGLGNLQSVLKAFERIGALVALTRNPQDIDGADAIVLPGVGAFGDGMKNLVEWHLVEPLRKHAMERRRPLLGICLGMQLMAETGEEHGSHQGLGLIGGRVVRIPAEASLRVPNMGWCDVTVHRPSVLLGKRAEKESFYFAHSYYFDCQDPSAVVATIEYGGKIPVVIERENLFGVQFHPEKSQDAGLNAINAFVKLVSA